MKIGHQLRFILTNRRANSLFSLIADGKYSATSLGGNTWKWLIGSQASLQSYCNKEGFNAVGDNPRLSKARIGITANQENNCGSCDSRIGFGTGGLHDDSNTCGNDNGIKQAHQSHGLHPGTVTGDTVNFPNFKPRSHHEVENVVS